MNTTVGAMTPVRRTVRNPWSWVPSLYFAEGIPYVVIITVSVIMYKRLGISNTDIALYTSLLYLAWVVKPLWSPLVDMFGTKRRWAVTFEFIIGVALAGVTFVLPLPLFFQLTLAVFWLMAFASATHDIAADGFYMLGLDQHQQVAFIGIRSTFYRVAMISGQGLLVMLAGYLEGRSGGNLAMAWAITFGVLSGVLFSLFVYHRFILPYPVGDHPSDAERSARGMLAEFFAIFGEFFRKKEILSILAFLLLYRLGEVQLVKLVPPFLLDPLDRGGLGLSTAEVGFVYGTIGIIALTCGGLLGGYVASKNGMRTWLWPMVVILHLPDLMFVYLSHYQPQNLLVINAAVALEQFGYGFGFTAYMLFMLLISEGEHKTAHYAICTGIMALGQMIPGMFSGMLADWLGYRMFFLWVILSTIPGFAVAALIRVPPGFGKKQPA